MKQAPLIAREVTLRYRTPKGWNAQLQPEVRDAATAAALIWPYLRDQITETAGVLMLDVRRCATAWHEVSRGSIDETIIQPADVYRAAIVSCAHAIVVAHSHPSGNPSPSPDDDRMARQLVAAGELLHLECLDVLILAPDRRQRTGYAVYSYKEHGKL